MLESYDDIVQYARDCMRAAGTATSKEVADELQRAAAEYQAKAAKIAGGKLPSLQRSAGAAASLGGRSQPSGLSNFRPFEALLSSAKHGFMAFWYSYVRMLNTIWPSITLEGKRLVIRPNVYKPIENEQACSQYCRAGDRVLDIGCGSGVGAVFCAPKALEVTAVDISSAAVENTEENCRLHGLKNVKVIQSDMFSRVEGQYDLILANSPYIDAQFEAEDQQFATSVKYLPTLFAQVGEYLTEDGRLLVQFPLGSRSRIERLAAEHGLELISMRPLPRKPLSLALWSVLYMQIGFKSTWYLLRRRQPDQSAAADDGASARSAPLAAA